MLELKRLVYSVSIGREQGLARHRNKIFLLSRKNKQALWEGRIQKYSGGYAVSIKEAGSAVTKVTARLEPACSGPSEYQKRNVLRPQRTQSAQRISTILDQVICKASGLKPICVLWLGLQGFFRGSLAVKNCCIFPAFCPDSSPSTGVGVK